MSDNRRKGRCKLMEIETTRFGTVQVSEDEIIRFPKGILGFEGIEQYVLIPNGDSSPFYFLQAVSDPDLVFVVTDPRWFCPDYSVQVYREDLRIVGAEEPDGLSVFVIVTVPRSGAEMTANLLAPIVVNGSQRLAKQVVPADSKYSTRHSIKRELERSRQTVGNAETGSGRPSVEGVAAIRTVG